MMLMAEARVQDRPNIHTSTRPRA